MMRWGDEPELPPEADRLPQGLAERAPEGMRTFTILRRHDASGVSGTGVVIEGILFSTGVVVVHWLTPAPWGSLNIFQSFDQFVAIHATSHPENRTLMTFDNGETLEL